MIYIFLINLASIVFCSASFITPTPKILAGGLGKRSVVSNCGYFSINPTDHVRCAGESTCSSYPGATTWGCCDSSSCYMPATCQNADATYCGGTPASLCPYSPIMKCTYGPSSECLTFIRQTAHDDTAKVTSWGCGITPTIFIIIAESSSSPSNTGASSPISSRPAPPNSSSSGLGTGAKAGLGIGVAVGGLIILGACAYIFYRAGKRAQRSRPREGDSCAGVVPKPELAGENYVNPGREPVPHGEEGVNGTSSGTAERAELADSSTAAELEGGFAIGSPAARC